MSLVDEFRSIIKYWTERHVDGFRLDVPQSINKDIKADSFNIMDTVKPENRFRSAEVINAIFGDQSNIDLLIEVFDLDGGMIDYYHNLRNKPKFMDIATKRAINDGFEVWTKAASQAVNKAGFALATESHDEPRFPSIAHLEPKKAIDTLFGIIDGKKIFNPSTIVIYQ